MKILVLQLARLGDIYQTWPVLSALKRREPNAEIHLLTRAKFAAAVKGDAIDRHWLLDTRDVLTPLIDEKPALDASMDKLDHFCESVRAENFDLIINLSFSPFSSYLASAVAGERSEVRGYKRASDGFLSIPDDGSAYFYAQVGIGRPNRLHVTDLFAFIAGVDLTESDWEHGRDLHAVEMNERPIVIHVGASVAGKTLSWSKWLQVVRHCLQKTTAPIVLVGSKEEAEIGRQIAAVSGDRRPVNLVGETTLEELFAIISEARVLVGGDSGPVQIASLVGTPVLNISFPMVNFWETGPRSKGSRIWPITAEEAISADEIATEIAAMLDGKSTQAPIIRVLGPTLPYLETRPQPLAFEWELLRGLYMSEAFPAAPSHLFSIGVQRLADVNRLALEQIAAIEKNPRNKTASSILEQADPIMDQILEMVPELAPIVRWFRTERSRIGPMNIEGLVGATRIVHQRMADVLGLYLDENNGNQDAEGGNDDVVLG